MLRGLLRDRHSSTEQRLLWILGSPRSGSTWLLRMLNDCRGVTGVDEPLIGLHLAPFVCDRPGSQAEDFDLTNFTFNRIARETRGYFFGERYRTAWREPLRALICARFAAQVRHGLIAIKEPNGSQAADVILDAVPRSRLLFLLRDGRDVVDSVLDSLRAGSWLSEQFPIRGIDADVREEQVKNAAWKWVWQTEVVQEAFDRHKGPKLLVRYERLRAEPEAELARVLDWLGVSADVGALVERHAFERLEKRGPGSFNRSATPGGWRVNLSEREQATLEEIMGPTLRRFGFAPSPGDSAMTS